MVRTGVITLAALPFISALYIPHDFSGLEDIERVDPRSTVKSIVSTQELNGGSKSDATTSDPEFFIGKKKMKSHNKKKGCHSKKRIGGHESSVSRNHHAEKKGMKKAHHATNPSEGSGAVFSAANAQPIPDRYIVIFKNEVDPQQIAQHMNWLADASSSHAQTLLADSSEHPLLKTEAKHTVDQIYGVALKGYAGSLLPGVAEKLAELPEVEFAERDQKVWTLGGSGGNKDDHIVTENGAPWGLARLSHRKALSLGSFNKYIYDDEGGEDVTSYIIDTGVYTEHNDFGGRARWGKTVPFGDVDEDTFGHGSHCAGTIAGEKYGVAKNANVVAVKVLGSDGSGTMSDVISGVEWTVQAHREESKKNKKYKGSTANMSLGGGKSPSLDLAVNAATQAGVHFAVAAGNENQNACYVSPAGASEPVTVGATTIGDDRAYFSNYGSCVDIFAPGVNVLSVGISGPDSTEVMSGTSMATPHICGLLSYFLSLQPSTDSEYAVRGAVTPKELKEDIIAFGTPDKISNLDDASPNVLAYNGGGKDISFFWNQGRADEEEDDSDDDIGESLLDQAKHLAMNAWDVAEDLTEDLEDVISDLF